MNQKTGTESSSNHDDLEKRSTLDLIQRINKEDALISNVIETKLYSIEALIDSIVDSMKKGGRLFYIGAGTSGRLGILDASECPPTFGVPSEWVTGLIAGGDKAIRKAVEGAEDDTEQGFQDLIDSNAAPGDIVVGITASGTTPYVLGALKRARENGMLTGGISCNEGTHLSSVVEYPIEIVTGPEFVTGSTRMKAGTATKLVLNMISTATMIRLGRVQGNRMVDMQLSNAKLVRRGTRMIVQLLKLSEEDAHRELLKHGSVRNVLTAYEHR